MSVEAMSAVLNHSRAKGTDKLVLLGIANHQGDGGAWPTVATLARYANATERSVQRSIANLTRLGELLVERQAGGIAGLKSYQRPNRYVVTVTCPPSCDGTVNHRLRGYPQPQQLELDVPDLTGSDRATHTSPPDAHVTPGGDADVTHNRTHNPVLTLVPSSHQTAREDDKPVASPEVRAAAIAAARAGLRGRD